MQEITETGRSFTLSIGNILYFLSVMQVSDSDRSRILVGAHEVSWCTDVVVVYLRK